MKNCLPSVAGLLPGLALGLVLALPLALPGGAAPTAADDRQHDADIVLPQPMRQRSAEYDYDVPEPGSYQLPFIREAADGLVLDTNGVPANLHRLMAGRVVVLSFIYTRCTDPKACMRATGVLSEIQRMTRNDPELSRNLLLLTLSFDPVHDTPGIMARYGRVSLGWGTSAEWLFLTTRSQAELQPLLDAYGQRVDRRKKPGTLGPLQHNLRVYLIDPHRQVRNIYSYGLLDPRLVITDVQTLIRESRTARENAGRPQAAKQGRDPDRALAAPARTPGRQEHLVSPEQRARSFRQAIQQLAVPGPASPADLLEDLWRLRSRFGPDEFPALAELRMDGWMAWTGRGEPPQGSWQQPGHTTPGWRGVDRVPTSEMWLRQTFELRRIPTNQVFAVAGLTGEVEFFVNGVPVAAQPPASLERFHVAVFDAAGRAALRVGTNVVAVAGRDCVPGEFLDVALGTVRP